ncbi:AAA family ATPase [Moorena producens JHB]|uniref:AAA family ATPase n=1 Tax=Moorena producens (strain JHB) TaxID=1454205 RepID=A0A1D9G0K3_MOOP1|nr:ATP-binding protein [Moorena producens]AOY81172.1 AAA family ATPase [Moorena producens JHB]
MTSATVRKNPYIRRNPYIVGRPISEPELFFGRRNKFDFIEDNLRQGVQVILFHGQRRIGKSTVLKQIPNFVGQNDFVFVQFDLQDKSQLSLSRLLYSLAQAIIKQLQLGSDPSKLPTVTELETNPTLFADSFLPKVYQQLWDKKLVLLLDEFDVLSSNSYPSDLTSSKESSSETFFPYLKSLIQQEQRLFIIPFIGRQMDDMPKLLGLFKGAPSQKVGLLSERSATELITEPAKGSLTYESEAIDAILALTSGHPYFTQVLCHALFAQARTEQKWQVTRDDVTRIVDDAIEIGEGGLTWFRDGLPIPERVIFSAVAEAQRNAERNSTQIVQDPLSLLEEYGVTITESLTQAREKLVESGFLGVVNITDKVSSYKEKSYKVEIELVRRWLVQRYPLRREIFELEDLDPEAKASYKKAIELNGQGDVFHRLKRYQQVLKANPNHFSALFEIARIYLEGHVFDKAVECYQRAYQVNPVRNQDGLLRSHLGYAQHLMEVGEVILAREQFEQVLKIEPGNKLAYEKIEALIVSSLEHYNKNPFVVGAPVPPDRFVGRRSEIQAAFDQIYNRSNLAIWCGPGMGKTSFLELLASPEVWQEYGQDPSQAVMVLLSCESIQPFTDSGFWQEVLTELIDKLDSEPDLQTEIETLLDHGKATARGMRQVLKQLGKRNKFLLLLVDDYDAALRENPQYTQADMETFVTEFRSIAYHSRERRYLSMIVTSLRRLNELGPALNPNISPWYNHYLFGSLKPLTETEVDTLLQGIPITPALRDVIQNMAGGRPALLQIAGSLLFRELRTGKLPDTETFTKEFESQTRHIFQNIWQRCSDLEQGLLILMAWSKLKGNLEQKITIDLSDIDLVFSQQELDLSSLEQQGLIMRNQDLEKPVYLFRSSIMEQWIIQEIKTSDQALVQKWQTILLKLINP